MSEPGKIKHTFICYNCSFSSSYDYHGTSPAFAKLIKLKEEAYVMKDPFTDDKRCIILGSHCSVCKKSVCVSQNCSYFYTRRFCIPCLMPMLDQFPEEVKQVQQLEHHVVQLKNILAKSGDSKEKGRKHKSQRPLDFNKYNTRHVALKFLYLGWDYNGYAVQEDSGNTIEHQLFEALLKTRLIESRESSNYHRCGRTDKGVSAFSQVISIDLRSNLVEGKGVKQRQGGTANERPGDKSTEINYVHILNKVLPPEIRILAWCPAEENFSARFSCTQRTYKYFFPQGNIDLMKMKAGAEHLIGEHDFRNLCKMDVQNGVVNYKRRIHSVSVSVDTSNGHGFDMCQLTVVGQAFLWHQIRCIVAVLFLIGQGKEEPGVIKELLDIEKHPCKPQYTMASELPLVLFECEYDDLEWMYNMESHTGNIQCLQEIWSQHAIKTEMIKTMLDRMCNVHIWTKDGNEKCWREQCGEPVLQQADCLMGGSKPRVYKSLLEREKCDTLESKIEHLTKKRKIVME